MNLEDEGGRADYYSPFHTIPSNFALTIIYTVCSIVPRTPCIWAEQKPALALAGLGVEQGWPSSAEARALTRHKHLIKIQIRNDRPIIYSHSPWHVSLPCTNCPIRVRRADRSSSAPRSHPFEFNQSVNLHTTRIQGNFLFVITYVNRI